MQLKHLVLLSVSGVLFAIGLIGVITRRNIILVFISIEIMLNAANMAFIAFAVAYNEITPAAAAVFVMALAVVEAAVGLALIVTLHKRRGTLAVDALNLLKH
ncbi:MAG: NADH-quinone oxidoreductase subunit NuoK [Spirochaetes bacterium]|nr:NADH-quinone oxidoreductase subunit NuoK [Spirochaetota bacterium]